MLDYFNAISLRDTDMFFRLLDTYRIDATVLYPATPAVKLLDHLDGWTRVLTSELAVVHVRSRAAGDTTPKVKVN